MKFTKNQSSNRSTSYLRHMFLLFCLLISTVIVSAQTTVSGIVVDENNQPIIGATVFLEGTSNGSITDITGNYSFTTEGLETGVLIIRSVGYKTITQEINLSAGDVRNEFVMDLDLMGLDEIIVTGVVNPSSKLESSVSITTVNAEDIPQSAPRTTAEIFRTIPGIKAEASAGDGNTNISVRGVPISSGGSRYLQIQEDGLPILSYGDIAFGTQDQFVRADKSIARIEAIRGGSAATMTSNGPAGIINFISKTGAVEGGSVSASYGLDYNSLRTDFSYGSPLGEGTSFHVGGFFRQGEGPRRADHNVNLGGQIKANLTKDFENGFVRLYYKYLNDRTAAYMPMPLQVSGTNSDPEWESVPGFDALSNGLQTPFFQQNFGLGPDGNYRNVDIADGIHSNTNAIGTQIEFDLSNGWTVSTNARMAFNKGRFVAPFTAQVGNTADIVNGILTDNGFVDGSGNPLSYTLTNASDGSTLNNNNGLIQRNHLFDVELENFNNFMSDTRLGKSFGDFGLGLGLFKSHQNIEMAWLWNTYLMEVAENAQLVDISSNNTMVTDNGLVNYGVPFWGNCCTGKYNTDYDITAPYISGAYEFSDAFNVDASVRFDKVRVGGLVIPSSQVSNLDVNGNGIIDTPETSVSQVNNAAAKPVSYDYDYTSYSLGGNYKLSDAAAVFARLSQGYVGNGERATWHQGGPYLENGAPKNSLFQGEIGYKKWFENGGLYITGFYAKTEEEAGVEATTQRVLSNDYRSLGLEGEANWRINNLDLRGALTFVDAEIVDNDGNVNIGNTPRRQPAFSYNLLPAYTTEQGHSFGLSLIGQTKAYAQDDNMLVMPGYNIVNGFATANLSKGLDISINANNIFNTIGITESEEGAITEGTTNYLRARSITGRSVVASVNLNF